MPRPKRPTSEDERPDGDEEEGNGEGAGPRRDGSEHRVHEEIVARRLGGGAPATPEAYARALEQWHQLPGSVMRPPTDVTPPSEEPATPSGEDEVLPPPADTARGEEQRP